jgi:hypothetical protein
VVGSTLVEDSMMITRCTQFLRILKETKLSKNDHFEIDIQLKKFYYGSSTNNHQPNHDFEEDHHGHTQLGA